MPQAIHPLTYPVADSELADMALRFYQLPQNRKRYRQLRQGGELDEAIQVKVRCCKSEAESLMATGLWENEAWNRAIRSQILETESD